MSVGLSETKGPPGTCEHRPHVPPFDALRANRMPPDEVRRVFPRYDGICSLCAAKIKVYANLEHYQAGDWAEMPVETPKDIWDC